MATKNANTPMVRYKVVSGDAEEAKLIADLLQKELNERFDSLRNDLPAARKLMNTVAKWNDIALGLALGGNDDATKEAVLTTALKDATRVGDDSLATEKANAKKTGGDAKGSDKPAQKS